MIRVANLNAYKLKKSDRGTAGWKARVTAIQEIGADILGLEEVLEAGDVPGWDAEAASIIQDLAADSGLVATVTEAAGRPGQTAMAHNTHRGWYTALLWNPDTVAFTPGGFRPYGAPDFWHGLTTGRFDIGAVEPLQLAVYHGCPFRPGFRFDEALRLKSVFRRTGGAKAGVAIGDFNAPSAAKILGPDGEFVFYDAEPYLDQDHDDLEYQVGPVVPGQPQLARREQTEALLRRGYMVDVAAHLNTPWQPTVGHWEDGLGDPDPWGPRRIDLILATRPVTPALMRYGTHASAAARQGADHLPIYADIDPGLITRPTS